MRFSSIAVLVCAAVWPTSARAQTAPDPDALVWRREWPRFRAIEYVATGALLAGTAINIFFIDWPDSGDEAKNPFDDSARKGLAAESRQGRDNARVIGDIGFRSMLLYPYLVDVVGVAWIGHGSPDVATQMALIDTQSFGLAGFVSLTVEKAARRARPSTRECDRDEDYESYCDGAEEYASFYSGHMAIAVTGAGLTCAHHQNLPLYGGGAGDLLACIGTSAIAITTGVARVVNDRHWATDVLLGSGIGVVSGYVLPMVLHYSGRSEPRPSETKVGRFTFAPYSDGEHFGAQWVGVF